LSSDSIAPALKEISQRLSKIYREMYSIRQDVQEIAGRVDQLEKGLKAIKSTLTELIGSVNQLENELENTKNELTIRIDAVENEVRNVEKRVDEAEKNLDKHLAEQDVVLSRNSEALLNNLAMQFVVNVVSKMATSAHIVLGHLNGKPFIVIESSNYIYMVLISIEVLEEDMRILKNLKEILEEYSDKEVKYNVLTTDVSEAEAPAWLYSLQ